MFSPSFSLDRCTTFLCLNLLKALSISSRGKMVKWPVRLEECFSDPWLPAPVLFVLLGTFLHNQRPSVAGAVTASYLWLLEMNQPSFTVFDDSVLSNPRGHATQSENCTKT